MNETYLRFLTKRILENHLLAYMITYGARCPRVVEKSDYRVMAGQEQ